MNFLISSVKHYEQIKWTFTPQVIKIMFIKRNCYNTRKRMFNKNENVLINLLFGLRNINT